MTKSNAREQIADIIADNLGDVYCCTRVWEAWSVGTMSQSDFRPAGEDENLSDDIASILLAALPSILEGMVKPLEFVKLSENCHIAMINKMLNIRVETYGSGKWCVLWSVPGYCDTYVEGGFQTAKDGIDAANEERFSEFLSAIGVET